MMVTQNNLIPRCYYGAANTGVVLTMTSIVLELKLVYPRPEILLELEKEFSKKLRFIYLTRYIEPLGNAIGILRTYTHKQAFSKANQFLPRYCFIIFKRQQDDAVTVNFNRCCHTNIQNINIRYYLGRYPFLDQNADFLNNLYAKFYNDYIEVCRSQGLGTGLSIGDFRNNCSIFAIDLSVLKEVVSGDLSVNIVRRAVPANNDDVQNPRELACWLVFLRQQYSFRLH